MIQSTNRYCTMEQVQMMVDKVRTNFKNKFEGETGNVYAAPGRINLIGEHTDYNGGYVFPGAVDKGIVAEIKPNGTNMVKAYAIDLDEDAAFDINDPAGPGQSWARYIFGDRKSTRLNSSHIATSRMPSSA